MLIELIAKINYYWILMIDDEETTAIYIDLIK